MSMYRWNEEWKELACSDCDPEANTPGAEDNSEHEKAFVMLIPMADEVPDFCPRCHQYLSLDVRSDGLQVRDPAWEAWVTELAEQKAKEAAE